MEPVVHKLRRLIREKNISHASIAEKMGKHRSFITKKLNSDSMETRILEAMLDALEVSYADLFCDPPPPDTNLRQEFEALREEVNQIKEYLPEYKKRSDL